MISPDSKDLKNGQRKTGRCLSRSHLRRWNYHDGRDLGRNAVKKGAKAVGQFGKALANLAKKAGPAIATILNVLAQVLTWGAKALEFLSRNLWIVALFLTYLVYDTVKERMKSKN